MKFSWLFYNILTRPFMQAEKFIFLADKLQQDSKTNYI